MKLGILFTINIRIDAAFDSKIKRREKGDKKGYLMIDFLIIGNKYFVYGGG